MKKTLFSVIFGLALCSTAPAATFRVNNAPGSGAQFTNFADAQEAASDGDVIIFDGSATSYGDIEITKRLTIKGPGFFLDENQTTTEGVEYAAFNNVKVKAAGTMISGIVVNEDAISGSGVKLLADDIVVTRCYVGYIIVSESYSYSDQSISNA